MTISYQQQKQDYEDKGVVFPDDVVDSEYYNITMIMHASMELNNTLIFCTVIGHDYYSYMSEEVRLIVFNTLRKFVAWSIHSSITAKQYYSISCRIFCIEISQWKACNVFFLQLIQVSIIAISKYRCTIVSPELVVLLMKDSVYNFWNVKWIICMTSLVF